MKYRLLKNSDNDISNVLKTVLKNRNITDYNTYLHLTDDVLMDFNKLDNISEAVKCFVKHYENKDKIAILADNDVDGLCSSAMMYRYIKELDKDYQVKLIIHQRNKSHGLSDNDFELPQDVKLLIVPDAGTNDAAACKRFSEQGIDVLILDHHQKAIENPYAIIVNNQISKDYTNKELCGAGVTYKFLQALDTELWVEYADNYLDLCAFANIADDMDITSFETKRLIQKGFSNIRNEFFQTLIKAQEFSMNGIVSIHNVSWFLAPVINGMIRIGSFEDRELMFKAAAGIYEEFEYKKRATKKEPAKTILEDIYERAARLAKNAKGRQDKMRTDGLNKVIENIGAIDDDTKVVMCDVSDFLDEGLTGITAIRVAEYYQRPCILLKEHIKTDEQGNDITTYGGSMRNYDNSPVENFQAVINSCPAFNYCMGHPNAAGVDINPDKVDEARRELNAALSDVVYDPTYNVDFDLDKTTVSYGLIKEMAELEDYVGKGFSKPLIACTFSFERGNIELKGKENDTIVARVNDVPFYFFKVGSNPLGEWLNETWNDNSQVTVEVVGFPHINSFKGIKELQIVVEDFNVLKIEDIDNFQKDDIDDDDVW